MHIQYGDYKLKFSRVNDFRQEMIFSEDRFDYLYTKYSLSASCLLNLEKDATYFDPEPNTLAELIVAIRELFASRQKLTLRLSSYTDDDLIDEDEPQQGFDEDASENWPTIIEADYPDETGGPFLSLANYTNFIGGQTVTITIQADFAVYERCEGKDSFIRSHRWSQSIDLDESFYQTRVTEGVLVVNSSTGFKPADDLRRFAFPQLPATGWTRQLMSFRQSQDGRILRYVIRDKEFREGPPYPLTKFTGRYSETSDYGTIFYKNITLEGRAPREIPKQTILEKLAAVALSRLELTDLAKKDTIMEATIEEILEDNTMVMSIRALRGAGQILNGIPLTDGYFGKTIPGNNGVMYDFADSSLARDQGNDFLALMFAPWQVDYCTALNPGYSDFYPVAVPPSGRFKWKGLTSGSESTASGTTNPAGVTASEVSYDNIQNPYLEDNYRCRYETRENRLQLPVARSADEDDENFKRSVVVRTAASQTVRIVEFEYRRVGKWPILPEPLNFEGESILAYDYNPRPPALLPDGQTYVYHVTGRMEFAVLNGVDRKTPAGLLTPGKLPSNQMQVQAAQIPADAYSSYLTHYSGNLPASTGVNPGGPDIPIA